MTKLETQYLTNPTKYKALVWDYNLSPQDFFAILHGEKKTKWPSRDWATIRVLENANYYDAINLIDLDYLAKNWQNLKPQIFKEDIQEGYEYLLRKRTLSSTR